MPRGHRPLLDAHYSDGILLSWGAIHVLWAVSTLVDGPDPVGPFPFLQGFDAVVVSLVFGSLLLVSATSGLSAIGYAILGVFELGNAMWLLFSGPGFAEWTFVWSIDGEAVAAAALVNLAVVVILFTRGLEDHGHTTTDSA